MVYVSICDNLSAYLDEDANHGRVHMYRLPSQYAILSNAFAKVYGEIRESGQRASRSYAGQARLEDTSFSVAW